jgi:hypothetical protein
MSLLSISSYSKSGTVLGRKLGFLDSTDECGEISSVALSLKGNWVGI